MIGANKKSTFALFLGNRGFFPASLIAAARDEVTRTLKGMGHEVIALDPGLTRHGAIETPAEGEIYAKFLKENDGKFDGVILSLPNFGDENGAAAALIDANVPIFIQAYPDEMDKMGPDLRRDAFCGKMSIMDVFYQNDIPFTALTPHVVAPSSPRFAENIEYFDRVCQVVKGISRMRVGAIGARTTPFKTVRIDEVALQRAGITVETYDLTSLFAKMNAVDASSAAFKDKAEALKKEASFDGVPADAFEKIVRLGVALEQMIEEDKLDALTLRCWTEFQTQMGISTCVAMSEINNRGIATACEVDIGSAVAMRALTLASGQSSTTLDWNNNYGDEDEKCILFHCGQVPSSMLKAPGKAIEHAIIANAVGSGCSYGCVSGRIAPSPMTFSGLMTDCGELKFYVGEGEFTDDPIPDEFFGSAGVAEIPELQDVLLSLGYQGHRHHVAVTTGHVSAILTDALGYYLGHEVGCPQCE